MIEVDCRKCVNLSQNGCSLYGNDADVAVARCAENCFFNYCVEQPKGDLISRKALRENVNAFYDSHFKGLVPNELITYAKAVDDLIDNAPPVETDIEVVAKDAYEHGYTDGWKERFGEPDGRSKGEWKLVKDKGNNIHAECPFCKFQIKCIAYNYSIWEVRQFIKNGDFDFEFPNFCENCGAQMKGGAEE